MDYNMENKFNEIVNSLNALSDQFKGIESGIRDLTHQLNSFNLYSVQNEVRQIGNTLDNIKREMSR